MLRTRTGLSLLIGLISILSLGCQNKVHDENVKLHRQNRELQDQLSSAPDPNQVAQLQSEISARDAKIQDLENQLRQPAPGQQAQANRNGGAGDGEMQGLSGIEVTRDEVAGTVTVRVPGDVLFDSGKATLKTGSQSTLNKIAAALKKDYSGKKVFVVGHTDSDPIAKTKGIWDDNLDLSAARARAVHKYLVDQGVPPKLLGLRAMADTDPRPNKNQSRRVEIVVSTRD
jgi:flagellar motor protein MotB